MRKISSEELAAMADEVAEEIAEDWGGGCSTHKDYVRLTADVAARVFSELYIKLQDD
ncbi:MAG: hypothetical protein FWF30_01025 [Coriobacteriia bacterium]|nr:hypothetical protein [Coriobacteriia bacterium]